VGGEKALGFVGGDWGLGRGDRPQIFREVAPVGWTPHRHHRHGGDHYPCRRDQPAQIDDDLDPQGLAPGLGLRKSANRLREDVAHRHAGPVVAPAPEDEEDVELLLQDTWVQVDHQGGALPQGSPGDQERDRGMRGVGQGQAPRGPVPQQRWDVRGTGLPLSGVHERAPREGAERPGSGKVRYGTREFLPGDGDGEAGSSARGEPHRPGAEVPQVGKTSLARPAAGVPVFSRGASEDKGDSHVEIVKKKLWIFL